MKKALVTALLLASSSVAMAKPVTYSASASVSIGFNSNPSSRPVVRDHRHADPDCTTAPAPVVAPVVKYRRPIPPVASDVRWQPIVQQPVRAPEPMFPTTTFAGNNASSYTGVKPYLQPGYRSPIRGWVEMTQPTRIEMGREYFSFGAQDGRFRQIQLVENAGSSFIKTVAIEFVGEARPQVITYNANLVPGAPLTIDLQGDARQINRIVVAGTSAWGSAYQILGM